MWERPRPIARSGASLAGTNYTENAPAVLPTLRGLTNPRRRADGVLSSHGYGRFRISSWPYPAHRVALMLDGRDVPNGELVDHLCFNHACVRPEHLRLTTYKQNAEHRSGANRGAAVPVRGVYFRRAVPNRPYYVKVKHLGKQYNGGSFATLEEAERVAIEMRAQLFTHDDGALAG